MYIAAQIVGGIVGVLAAHAMFELPLWQVSVTIRTGVGQWFAEGVATFGLLLTVLATRSAYAIGLYITAAYWFTASTSFANPAVTIARALSDTYAGIAPGGVLAFIAAQIAGALLAVAVARWLLDAPASRASVTLPTPRRNKMSPGDRTPAQRKTANA